MHRFIWIHLVLFLRIKFGFSDACPTGASLQSFDGECHICITTYVPGYQGYCWDKTGLCSDVTIAESRKPCARRQKKVICRCPAHSIHPPGLTSPQSSKSKGKTPKSRRKGRNTPKSMRKRTSPVAAQTSHMLPHPRASTRKTSSRITSTQLSKSKGKTSKSGRKGRNAPKSMGKRTSPVATQTSHMLTLPHASTAERTSLPILSLSSTTEDVGVCPEGTELDSFHGKCHLCISPDLITTDFEVYCYQMTNEKCSDDGMLAAVGASSLPCAKPLRKAICTCPTEVYNHLLNDKLNTIQTSGVSSKSTGKKTGRRQPGPKLRTPRPRKPKSKRKPMPTPVKGQKKTTSRKTLLSQAALMQKVEGNRGDPDDPLYEMGFYYGERVTPQYKTNEYHEDTADEFKARLETCSASRFIPNTKYQYIIINSNGRNVIRYISEPKQYEIADRRMRRMAAANPERLADPKFVKTLAMGHSSMMTPSEDTHFSRFMVNPNDGKEHTFISKIRIGGNFVVERSPNQDGHLCIKWFDNDSGHFKRNMKWLPLIKLVFGFQGPPRHSSFSQHPDILAKTDYVNYFDREFGNQLNDDVVYEDESDESLLGDIGYTYNYYNNNLGYMEMVIGLLVAFVLICLFAFACCVCGSVIGYVGAEYTATQRHKEFVGEDETDRI